MKSLAVIAGLSAAGVMPAGVLALAGEVSVGEAIQAGTVAVSALSALLLFLWRRAERAEQRAENAEEENTCARLKAVERSIGLLGAKLEEGQKRRDDELAALREEMHRLELRMTGSMAELRGALAARGAIGA